MYILCSVCIITGAERMQIPQRRKQREEREWGGGPVRVATILEKRQTGGGRVHHRV